MGVRKSLSCIAFYIELVWKFLDVFIAVISQMGLILLGFPDDNNALYIKGMVEHPAYNISGLIALLFNTAL